MEKIRHIIFQHAWHYVVITRSSLWFLPGLMIGFSIILGFSLIELDTRLDLKWAKEYPHTFGLGADGSRGMLTAIASSMLTVAALCFSLTLSTISQASSQYSPRTLRNFIRDRSNQFVLGYFVSVFAYCLIVLRTIRGGDEVTFVPSLAVISGLILAIGGIIVLIYFIHHMATSLQVANVIQGIKEETLNVIDQLFPDTLDDAEQHGDTHHENDAPAAVNDAVARWFPVRATSSGYVQYVDIEAIASLAEEHKAVLKMEHGIGHFIVSGSSLLMSSVMLEEDAQAELNSIYNIYHYRTIEADVGFGIRQIVDIGLKALSSGVNDTSTGITCIDFLGVIAARLASRKLADRYETVDGELRLIVKAPDFAEFLGTAFDQIRSDGRNNLAILIRLLKRLADAAQCTTAQHRLQTLKEHMEQTRDIGMAHLDTHQQAALCACYDYQVSRLNG